LDVRARIRAIDPDAFVTDVRSMEQVIAGSQAERRAGTLLVAVVSGIALILVLGGVYSVIAQSVVQRKREMAIRSALGAEPWRVIALAMRTALLPAVIGIALGTLGGLVMTRRMGSVLYGVNSSDQTAWLSACGIVLIACVAAGYLPARRAAQVDAMTALTAE
jgi:ABC-type antimicrobial peptide transport system permease subunit